MNSYIELKWVQGIDKDIPFPDLIFGEFKDFSGVYYKPENAYIKINENMISIKKGLILVNRGCPSTIAHEWRHHWQHYNGIKCDNISFDNNYINYKEEVIKFYTKSRVEMDALLFELRKYPDDGNQETYEWIIRRNYD